MGRTPNIREESPLHIVMTYCGHYSHGPHNQYDHLHFFSKDRSQCDSLTVFGGNVYRRRGGWSWVLSSRKSLIALCKLLEPFEKSITNEQVKQLMKRMKRRRLTVYDV